jgi:pyridinium-3,5-bisthiocarboxylic acid mononucleotide nickel chelatase
VSRVAYFDCASGASGDMILGALVDMGLPVDSLRAELGKLRMGGYRLEARRVHRAGLHATKVDVVIEHGPEPEGEHVHGHRRLGDILASVDGSGLAAELKSRASALFSRLAEAEAAVHGTSPDEVRFHEVGAVDSIVDVVGAVIGLAWLKADRYVASPLNVGSGTVTMDHGTFSVPPPATAQLVKGAPVYGAGEGELLTPTGALIVTAYATSYGPLPPLRLDHVGHGAGSRETGERPNVMRLVVGEEGETGSDRVLVLEAEVDDMAPQLFGPLIDRLLGAGALDAYLTPIQMKKGRPGVLVTVLAPLDGKEAVEELLFAETTTLGVRRQVWERSVLDREVVRVETPYGPIGVKVGRRAGRLMNAQPEFDDCVRAAEAAGVPVKEAWAAALAAFRARS